MSMDLYSLTLPASFIECFCKADISSLASLLSDDFHLKGPLFEFHSKEAYIQSLEGNLEADPDAKVLSITGSEGEAAGFFIYKGNTVAQLFRCRDGKIYETILVFDAGKVT